MGGFPGTHRAGGGEAVHPGQVQVDEDEVESACLEGRDGLLAIRGDLQIVRRIPEIEPHQCMRLNRIVDQ